MQIDWIEESHAVARTAVLEAGALLARLSTGPLDVRLKHGHELVTRADVESEQLIERIIQSRFPRHRIVSEESWTGWSDSMLEGPTWIVDPLDGTVNFAHGHLHCAVSVAFALDGQVLSGAIRGPFLGQTFDAK